MNSKNNNNNNNNSKNVSIGRTLTNEKELSTTLHDMLVDYIKQQNKLNDLLRYDETRIKAYFLVDITDIFHKARYW